MVELEDSHGKYNVEKYSQYTFLWQYIHYMVDYFHQWFQIQSKKNKCINDIEKETNTKNTLILTVWSG